MDNRNCNIIVICVVYVKNSVKIKTFSSCKISFSRADSILNNRGYSVCADLFKWSTIGYVLCSLAAGCCNPLHHPISWHGTLQKYVWAILVWAFQMSGMYIVNAPFDWVDNGGDIVKSKNICKPYRFYVFTEPLSKITCLCLLYFSPSKNHRAV